jgi:amino acid adenylation domain-containing protein
MANDSTQEVSHLSGFGQVSAERGQRGEVSRFHSQDRFVKDAERSVPDRFEEQVAKYSNNLAVKTKHHALTYEVLNKSANRVARAVIEQRGKRRDEPVAVIFDHDAPLIIAILGVLKSGTTCVVLDPSYPEARARHILEDAEVSLIVTNTDNLALARKFARPDHQLFNIDEIAANVSAENLGLSISPDAFAFVLYTSGSTGQPKGVIQSHRNVIHNALRYASGCRIGSEDRVTLLASLGTGQGTPTAFSALLTGATLYPLAIKQEGVAGLSNWLHTEEITVYISTPTLFRHLVATLTGEEEFPRLRVVRLGAEKIRKSDVELYKRHFPSHCTLAVFLSATEAGNFCQYFVDKKTEILGEIVSAGWPADGMDVVLLDDSGKEVGLDEIGEITVKSRYLAPGYWRKPTLTEAAFQPAPEGGDKRLYRTGDLGRMLPDGTLEHLGRKDFQVKIRGYRVEIAEIEAALLASNGIKEAVVVAIEDRPGDMQLVAYVVPTSQPAPSASELRSFLAEKLPDYMIPSMFVTLDALPLNPTGKIDRQALPRPGRERSRGDTPFIRPFETVEHQLAQIWEELLGIRPIGIKDDFFQLGGHSLLAAQMVHRIEQVCGRKVPLATLVTNRTIEQLSKVLIREQVEDLGSLLIQLQPGNGKRPLFFLHGDFEGGGFYCLNLARGLGENRPVYVLSPHGVDGRAIPPTIEAVAASYIEMIREVQPSGPYLLGGLCKGGVTAYEMARQLQRQGEQVDLVVMVGSTAWNTHFKFLHGVVSGIGYLLGMGPEGRASLFLKVRDHLIYHRNRFRRVTKWSFGERISRAFRLASKGAQQLRRQSQAGDGHRPNVDGTGLDHKDEAPNLPYYRELIEQGANLPYYKQLGGYVPGPYSGRVAFFWADEEPTRHPFKRSSRWDKVGDSTMGWGRVASALDVHIVPGVTNTAITTHVNILADQMKSYLDKAQTSIENDKSA